MSIQYYYHADKKKKPKNKIKRNSFIVDTLGSCFIFFHLKYTQNLFDDFYLTDSYVLIENKTTRLHTVSSFIRCSFKNEKSGQFGHRFGNAIVFI